MVFIILVSLILGLGFINSKNKISKAIYCTLIGLALIVVSGLRSSFVGTDTPTYVRMFSNAMPLSIEEIKMFLQDDEFLFYIYQSAMKTFTDSYTLFLLPIAIFYITAVSRFIRKYSSSPIISFILFMSMGYFSFSMAGLRQTIAMGILLFATDKMLDKKYVGATILILLASCFHITTLIYFVALALYILPLNKWLIGLTAIFSAVFYFGGNTITNAIVKLVWGEDRGYKEIEFGGTSTLFLLIIVALGVLVFYPKILNYSKTKKLRRDNSFEIDTFFTKLLLFSIPFQVMAIYQANAFRIAMLFHFPMIALLPNVINKQNSKAIRVIANSVVIVALLYQLFAIAYWSADINPFTFFWQV